MQTSLLHNLVVGTPIISATYDKLQTPVNRYLLDPAIQCHYSTTTSKQSKIFFSFSDHYLILLWNIDRVTNTRDSMFQVEYIQLRTNLEGRRVVFHKESKNMVSILVRPRHVSKTNIDGTDKELLWTSCLIFI